MTLEMIKQALELLIESGNTHELRILDAEMQGTVAGYFNDINSMADKAEKYSG